jgi:hypothetical protein
VGNSAIEFSQAPDIEDAADWVWAGVFERLSPAKPGTFENRTCSARSPRPCDLSDVCRRAATIVEKNGGNGHEQCQPEKRQNNRRLHDDGDDHERWLQNDSDGLSNQPCGPGIKPRSGRDPLAYQVYSNRSSALGDRPAIELGLRGERVPLFLCCQHHP